MYLISKFLKKKFSKLTSRFEIPKIPHQMVNQLGVEREATSTN